LLSSCFEAEASETEVLEPEEGAEAGWQADKARQTVVSRIRFRFFTGCTSYQYVNYI